MEIDKNNKIYQKVEIPFGWRRNLNYFNVNFFLMLKNTIEYKANFYLSIFNLIFFSIIQIFAFSMFSYVFSESINWEIIDYLLFYILSFLMSVIAGFFSWGKELRYILIEGYMNVYLTKPITIFICYIFSTLSGWAFLSVFFRILVLISIFIYFRIIPENILLSIFIILLLNLVFFTIIQFIDSLEFLGKNLSVEGERYFNFYEIFGTYPAPIFKEFPIKFLPFLFPVFFIGSLLIPLLRGYDFMFDPYLQVGIIIGLIIIFGMGTWLNWHYGLKKYEAFG